MRRKCGQCRLKRTEILKTEVITSDQSHKRKNETSYFNNNNATLTKYTKMWNRYQERESVQIVPNAGKKLPVPNAGEDETLAKRGKKCNRCQARENVHLVPDAGKMLQVPSQAQEKMQPLPSAGKDAACSKSGKTCIWCQAREKM